MKTSSCKIRKPKGVCFASVTYYGRIDEYMTIGAYFISSKFFASHLSVSVSPLSYFLSISLVSLRTVKTGNPPIPIL